jgi:hypothetical protein
MGQPVAQLSHSPGTLLFGDPKGSVNARHLHRRQNQMAASICEIRFYLYCYGLTVAEDKRNET